MEGINITLEKMAVLWGGAPNAVAHTATRVICHENAVATLGDDNLR